MGRTKRKKSNNIKKDESEDSSGSNAMKRYPLESHLNKAEENIDSFNFELAEKFCEKALQIEPNNLKAVDLMANVLLEMGRIEEAAEFMNRSISINPDVGYTKYLSLAQLASGKESLQFYQKGVEIIEKEICENDDGSQGASVQDTSLFKRILSSAYCCMAELFMTDCCDEDKAEETCLAYLKKAIETDETNPESYQAMASYYLVINDQDKAREMMTKSLDLWLPRYKEFREGDTEISEDEDDDVCPLDYSSRVEGVKTLLELEMYNEAEVILNGLVDESNEVVEVWYLLGWMNHLRGEDYSGNARFYFQKCKTVASKVGCNDAALLEHVDELLEELGSEMDEDEDNNKENENDDDDDDLDSQSSEEEMAEGMIL